MTLRLTTRQAAERLGMTVKHLQYLCRAGRMPYVQTRSRGALEFEPRALDRWAEGRRKAEIEPALIEIADWIEAGECVPPRLVRTVISEFQRLEGQTGRLKGAMASVTRSDSHDEAVRLARRALGQAELAETAARGA